MGQLGFFDLSRRYERLDVKVVDSRRSFWLPQMLWIRLTPRMKNAITLE
jgi:hypothetical protein